MDFRLLGAVTAHFERVPVDLGEPQQRLFLAILLLAEGRLVPTEALVDRIWGERPPPTAHRLLTNIAHKVRSLLDAGQPGAGDRLPPSAGGYRMLADPQGVDLWRFRHLCSQARQLANSDPAEALRSMRLGLTEWDESPGDPLRPEPLFRLEGEWIAKMRLTLQHDYRRARIDCARLELRLGPNNQALAELEALARIDPLDETVAELRMRAHCLADQFADAEVVFREVRRHLNEELGADPDSALLQLYQRVLDNDLDLRSRPAADHPPMTIEEPVTDPGPPPPDKVTKTLARSAAHLVVATARDGSADRAGAPGGELVRLLRNEFDGDDLAAATLTRVLSTPGDSDAVRQLRQLLVVCLGNDQSFRQDVEHLVGGGPTLAKGGIFAEKVRNAAVYNEKVVINRGGFRIGG